jgi:predicted Zn-dependent peptidase
LQFLLGVLSPELIGQEDLDRERRVLLKEYIQHGPGRQRRCDFLAAQQARRLQAANKLDLPVAEYGKTLDGIGVARANDFRAMHYRHEFARLVVVSTFSADEIVRLLPSATAESARTTPHSAPRRTAYVEREHFIWNGNRSSHVSVTYLSENSSPLRQFVGDTLQDQLHNRQDSPFYRYLRQQLGKTYSIDVSFTRLFDRSKLMVSLAIDKRDVHGCLVWIIDQLARLAAEGWTEGTYERIRQRFIRKQDLWFEGAYQVATYLGCELLRDESQRMLSPQDYRSLAENATLESVNQELRKLLAPQNRFTTIVGPIRMFGKWRLRRQLAALGNDQATVNSGSEATR